MGIPRILPMRIPGRWGISSDLGKRAGSPLIDDEACSLLVPVALLYSPFFWHYYNSSVSSRGQTQARIVRLGSHGVVPGTQGHDHSEYISPLFSAHLSWRLACHSLCRGTLSDWGAHHDRHTALRNTRRNHHFCGRRRRGVSLDAAARHVRPDASCDGPSGESS